MYKLVVSNKCKKDIKLAKKQNRNMDKLFMIIDMLLNNASLPKACNDHYLIGEYGHCRECHIDPDWLLIYRIYEKDVVLYLTRIGSHSELFHK